MRSHPFVTIPNSSTHSFRASDHLSNNSLFFLSYSFHFFDHFHSLMIYDPSSSLNVSHLGWAVWWMCRRHALRLRIRIMIPHGSRWRQKSSRSYRCALLQRPLTLCRQYLPRTYGWQTCAQYWDLPRVGWSGRRLINSASLLFKFLYFLYVILYFIFGFTG